MDNRYDRYNPPELPYNEKALYILVHSMFLIVGNSQLMTTVLQDKLHFMEEELLDDKHYEEVVVYRTPCNLDVYKLGIFICGVN